MKKIIFALALSFAFAGLSVNHLSASTCGDPKLNHDPITTVDPITFLVTTVPGVYNLSCDGSNPENVVTAWGKNSDHNRYKPGETFTNTIGFQETCPAFFPLAGCVDITNSPLWRSLYWNK